MALRYIGGKFPVRHRLCELFGDHLKFADFFGGGLGYFKNKTIAPIEVVNDIDPDLINFYRVVQNHCNLLKIALQYRNYAEETFEWASDYKEEELPIYRAAKYFVRNRMSRDANMTTYTTSPRIRRGRAEMESSYLSAIDRLESVSERVAHVNFLNNNIFELLESFIDDPDFLIYLDPPYLHETRTSKKLYAYEMTDQDHIKLLTLVNQASARVVISGYANKLYNCFLDGWKRFIIPTKVNMGGATKKGNRVEVLWYNR
jgi:DNA adenine methylase